MLASTGGLPRGQDGEGGHFLVCSRLPAVRPCVPSPPSHFSVVSGTRTRKAACGLPSSSLPQNSFRGPWELGVTWEGLPSSEVSPPAIHDGAEKKALDDRAGPGWGPCQPDSCRPP